MNIELTKTQIEEIVSEAKSQLVRLLITRKHPIFEGGDAWDYFLEVEICGILKISRRTLMSWRVPRYPMPPSGKIVYYRLSEVDAFIKTHRER